MDVVTFLVITLLCLAFPPTRSFGFIGLVILCLAYPFVLITIGVLSLLVHFLIRYYKRRQHDLPRLPERRSWPGTCPKKTWPTP